MQVLRGSAFLLSALTSFDHHHVGDYGLIVEDHVCYGSVNNDLDIPLMDEDTKRNMDFVGDFKKTRKYVSKFLERFPHLVICIQLISSQSAAKSHFLHLFGSLPLCNFKCF